MPTISVALATYNGADFILEQLESIRNQTLPVTQVVICDDRSKDNTVDIVEKYIKENELNGWSIEVNETNLGFGSNFAKALSKCTCDYIFFSDQDDIWMLDKFEKMVGIMEEKAEVKLLCSEYEIFSTGNEIPENAKNFGKNNKRDGSLEKIEPTPHNFFIGSLGCDMCIRKTFSDEIAPYFFPGWAHDEYVWKLAQLAGGCYVYHEELIRHRVHAHNVTMHKIHNLDKRIEFLELLLKGNESCRKYVENNTRNDEYLRLIDKNIKSEKLRIDLLKNKHIFNTFTLFFYSKYYHSRKALLMEPWIAIRNK